MVATEQIVHKSADLLSRERREVRKLATLVELGRTLADTTNLQSAFSRALEILGKYHGLLRSFVMLLDPDTEKIRLYATYGLNLETARRVTYKVGEGVIGRVVESAKPVVVPQTSKEPLLLNRLRAQEGNGNRREMSFFCIPIVIDGVAIGALGADRIYRLDRDYDRTTKFLSVIASMLAQALKVEQHVAADKKRLVDENIHLKQELREKYDFSRIVGNSNPMRKVYEQVTQVARTNTTVLLRGESGTGKEMVAHAIHYNSLRTNKPFVKVSCAALPETLIESELFGYEKGAFTGAQARKKGRFELADGGTLFLDEIGDLNLSTQVKLLRVLQEREFERLGGTETIRVNVRLIVATNKELEAAISESQFREDLYYRLNVFTIFMPPLRERKPDILLLAEHFVEKFEHEHHKHIKRISTPAIDMLTSYHWPGNVRELENVIERAVLVCDSNVIHGHHLPPSLQTAEGSDTVTRLSLATAMEAYERDLIQDALKTSRGNRAKAAKLLDTTERIIGYKVKKYRISCDRYRT
ncbi:MAG TPA: sigma 54-interacting transcriptional regulator [Pyrinomonadaceae bacterium]|nr:sigma 54-interacting transcriptional regulator [Pyrinomonadaceae bacterium]